MNVAAVHWWNYAAAGLLGVAVYVYMWLEDRDRP
jgi:hypothetical protein